MNTIYKKSDKIKILSQKELDMLQQSTSQPQKAKTIKNSKYKRAHASGGNELNLLSFVAVKTKKVKDKWKHKKSRYVVGSSIVKVRKKRNKIKEKSKKKHSTLKKAILRYRQGKRKAIDLDVLELSEQFKVLTIPKTNPKENNLHSRKFRSYCDNCTTPLLGELVEKLLRDLDRFQKRAHQQNEVKAHAKRRFVLGFRECLNFLNINKAKLVIIAPDCEECAGSAGLDETIKKIKTHCLEKNIPYLFSLQRRQISYVLFKKVPVSCICILDYDGANETFNQILMALKDARIQYQNLTMTTPSQMEA